MNRLSRLSVVLLVLLACVACASAPRSASTNEYGGRAQAPAVSPAKPALDAGQPGESQQSDERMIVRTATLSLVVSSTDDAVASIRSLAASFGGYVVDTNLWRDEEQLRGTVTIRVPADDLDAVLQELKKLSVKVERESGTSQDVTEEYSDLGARLRNLEATESELLELLGTVREKTGKAEDILAVHRELTNIRGQIEQLKGRMQYLDRTAAMSAVSIELIPDILAQPIAGSGWRPSATLVSALRSLTGTLRFLVDAIIVLVFYLLPVLAVVLIPVAALVLVIRRWRRRSSRKIV